MYNTNLVSFMSELPCKKREKKKKRQDFQNSNQPVWHKHVNRNGVEVMKQTNRKILEWSKEVERVMVH